MNLTETEALMIFVLRCDPIATVQAMSGMDSGCLGGISVIDDTIAVGNRACSALVSANP